MQPEMIRIASFNSFFYYYRLRNLLTVFFTVSRDVLAFSKNSYNFAYKAARFFTI